MKTKTTYPFVMVAAGFGWFAVFIPLCLSVVFIAAQRPVQPPRDAAADEATTSPYPPPWATLVGSTERDKYHRLQCGIAQNIKPENTIWFADANDATENGYNPAGCNDRKCRPPRPDSSVQLGQVGGSGLRHPDPNPPEIPKANVPKGKQQANPPKGNVAKVNQPPPRMGPIQGATLNQIWQGVPPVRELEARKKWDAWATWAIDQWCERWHISSGGKIAKNAAYPPDVEQQLILKLGDMKDQIAENKKRIKALQSQIDRERN